MSIRVLLVTRLEVFQGIEATTRERAVPRMASDAQIDPATTFPPQCLLVRRDGHESPIEESAAPIYDRSDHISGMVVVFHDVSESREISFARAQAVNRWIQSNADHRSPSESNAGRNNSRPTLPSLS